MKWTKVAAALILAGTAGMARGQNAKPPKPMGRELEVSAAALTRPALEHRLFPIASERGPGDAVPMYLRLSLEYTTEMADLEKKPSDWNGLPDDKFPLAEAKAFVDHHRIRLELLEYAARRRECDWAYPLDEQRENAIEILLPDAQGLRSWARLLSLKARVEIAEGKTNEAIRTIETGLAMADHLAQGPFLINRLVGMAVTFTMLERLEDLIAHPGSPNLYWSLTALPRPFISLREALEMEQRMGDWMVPELGGLDEPRSPAEWTVRLDRLHQSLTRLGQKLAGVTEGGDAKNFQIESLDTLRREFLPKAKEAFPAAEMSDDERLARYIARQYRIYRDDVYKTVYLDPIEVIATKGERARSIEEMKREGTAIRLLAEIVPAVEAAVGSSTRVDRRIAALRAIEAIRLHAAESGGKLPADLASVKAVPVPVDPGTGRAFGYRLDGDTAVLTAPAILGPETAMEYRITLRK